MLANRRTAFAFMLSIFLYEGNMVNMSHLKSEVARICTGGQHYGDKQPIDIRDSDMDLYQYNQSFQGSTYVSHRGDRD